MPARRRSYRRSYPRYARPMFARPTVVKRKGTRLPYGVAKMAMSAARTLSHAKKIQKLDEAQQAYNVAADQAWKNINIKRDKAIAEGRGNYTIDNTLINHGNNPNGLGAVPSFSGSFSSANDETGALCVTRKELITTINKDTSGFDVQSFNINPGLVDTFPFLSNIAKNYDEYEFIGLIFTYVPLVVEASSDGVMGSIIMATNYNPSNGNFTSKNEMLQYDASSSCRVVDVMRHGVECEPSKRGGNAIEYIRTRNVPMTEIKDYDQAIFQIATSGLATDVLNADIGELWVTYKVVLRKPKLPYSEEPSQSCAWSQTSSSSVTGTLPFGPRSSNLKWTQNDSIGGLLDTVTGTFACYDIDVTDTTSFSNLGGQKFTFPDGFQGTVMIEFLEHYATSVTDTAIYKGNVESMQPHQLWWNSDDSTSPKRAIGNGTSKSIIMVALDISPTANPGGNYVVFRHATESGVHQNSSAWITRIDKDVTSTNTTNAPQFIMY